MIWLSDGKLFLAMQALEKIFSTLKIDRGLWATSSFLRRGAFSHGNRGISTFVPLALARAEKFSREFSIPAPKSALVVPLPRGAAVVFERRLTFGGDSRGWSENKTSSKLTGWLAFAVVEFCAARRPAGGGVDRDPVRLLPGPPFCRGAGNWAVGCGCSSSSPQQGQVSITQSRTDSKACFMAVDEWKIDG